METKIGLKDNFIEGKGKSITINDKKIAVFNIKGKFYAIDSACPHRGVDLSGGEFTDTVVRCPAHGWEFDVTTGEGVVMPVCVKRYEIKEKKGELFIEI